jgi:hypothetical protein
VKYEEWENQKPGPQQMGSDILVNINKLKTTVEDNESD